MRRSLFNGRSAFSTTGRPSDVVVVEVDEIPCPPESWALHLRTTPPRSQTHHTLTLSNQLHARIINVTAGGGFDLARVTIKDSVE